MHCYPAPEIRTDLRTASPSFLAKDIPRRGASKALAIHDIDMLLQAVTQRLRQAAGSDTPALSTLVLECTDALDQLHTALEEQREPLRFNVHHE